MVLTTVPGEPDYRQSWTYATGSVRSRTWSGVDSLGVQFIQELCSRFCRA